MERDFEDYINSIKSIISLRTLMHRYHENGTQTNSVATHTGTDEHSLPAISMQQDRSTPRRSFSEYDNYGYSDFCETVEELKTTRKRLYSLITELSREKVRLTRENKEIKRENEELKANKDQEKTRTDSENARNLCDRQSAEEKLVQTQRAHEKTKREMKTAIANRDEMIRTTNILKDSYSELKSRYKKSCTKMMKQKRQEAERITRMSDDELERSMTKEFASTSGRDNNGRQESEDEDTESQQDDVAEIEVVQL